jgi:hypothetical protein
MSNPFFDRPIINSPYERPAQHWELDADGQPTQRIITARRKAEFITPIPKAKKRKGKEKGTQGDLGLGRRRPALHPRPALRPDRHACRLTGQIGSYREGCLPLSCLLKGRGMERRVAPFARRRTR